MKLVLFAGEYCTLSYATYDNGRIAIRLVCQNGEPMATATVNVPGVNVPDGHVIIKDYSENEGMFKALVEAGVIGAIPLDYVRISQWVEAPICKLLVKKGG
jgi:hypothetical protein